ncbi:unnamed protein product [Closterium sp. NIES-54]
MPGLGGKHREQSPSSLIVTTYIEGSPWPPDTGDAKRPSGGQSSGGWGAHPHTAHPCGRRCGGRRCTDQYPHPAGVQRTTHGAAEGGGSHECAAAGADHHRSRPSPQRHPDQLHRLRHRLLHRRHPATSAPTSTAAAWGGESSRHSPCDVRSPHPHDQARGCRRRGRWRAHSSHPHAWGGWRRNRRTACEPQWS